MIPPKTANRLKDGSYRTVFACIAFSDRAMMKRQTKLGRELTE